MPSPFESLSLVVLEAWNRGTPVIVNARCDVLLGQVRRADGGLYYRSSEDFAGAVRRLAEDAGLARTFGRQGLAYVETRVPLAARPRAHRIDPEGVTTAIRRARRAR
jgi:glycosyltransferase involved in cell wall biosynthesis